MADEKEQVVTLPEGVSVSAEELAKIDAGLEALKKDAHAPREAQITITLHVHNEYPKTLYKGKETKSVKNETEETEAAKDGFGPYDHEAFTAIKKEEE
jgi:hypothetical protein